MLRQGCDFVICEINDGALGQNVVSADDIVGFMSGQGYIAWWIRSHSADWFRPTRMPTFKRVNETDISEGRDRSGDILFVNTRVTEWFLKQCGDLLDE